MQRSGDLVALAGAVAVLGVSGIGKFTAGEVEDLKPVFSGAPWLRWMKPVFGDAGSSHFLGVVEIGAAGLLAASPWSARAGIAGALLGTLTFGTTTSLLLANSPPVWDEKSGGAPFASSWGFLLLKDITLLGASLAILGASLSRTADRRSSESRGF